VPLVAPPVEKPTPVQEVAFVDDQVRVDEPPLETDVGFAVRETVGAGVPADTVTFVLLDALPPGPVQVM
jgi:hypothetical protein